MRPPRSYRPSGGDNPRKAHAASDAEAIDVGRLEAFSNALLAIHAAAESGWPMSELAAAFSRVLDGAQVRFIALAGRAEGATSPDSGTRETFVCTLDGQDHRLEFVREHPFDKTERFMMRALVRHLASAAHTAVPPETGRAIAATGRTGLSREGLRAMGLTPAEGEVMQGVVRGESNGEIASRLGRSRRTIEKHLENILGKLGVETRLAAARAVLRRLGLRVPGAPEQGRR